jgi:hypothetical protein
MEWEMKWEFQMVPIKSLQRGNPLAEAFFIPSGQI